VKELGAAAGLGGGVEAEGQWKGVVVSASPAAEVVPWPTQNEELDRGGRRGCGGGVVSGRGTHDGNYFSNILGIVG
jgi:hypothetical protein